MDVTRHETSITEDSVVASAIAFTEIARSFFLADSLEQTLEIAVDLFVVTIEACEFAGALLFEGDAIDARVCSDPVVEAIDDLLTRTREGPCLDAVAQGLSFYADELGTDPRWPHFGPAAAALGVRSLLALPMAANSTSGAINIYARYPQAFGVIDRARGLLLASMAGFACATRALSRRRETARRQSACRPRHPRVDRPSSRNPYRTRTDHRRPGVPHLAAGFAAPQCQVARSSPGPRRYWTKAGYQGAGVLKTPSEIKAAASSGDRRGSQPRVLTQCRVDTAGRFQGGDKAAGAGVVFLAAIMPLVQFHEAASDVVARSPLPLVTATGASGEDRFVLTCGFARKSDRSVALRTRRRWRCRDSARSPVAHLR